MSFTTIRYSGVPENSHSRRFDSGHDSGHSTEPTSDITADTAAYTGSDPRFRSGPRASRFEPTRPEPEREEPTRFEPGRGGAEREEPGRGGTDPGEPVRGEPNQRHPDSLFVPGFTPGKAAPVSDDPRHNHAFPHPQNPGLFTEPDGFYDWANRRLYLPDGSPDPMTPGAYRYQTRPDLCDLDAPDTKPSSPRYEPMHLRHKPGDTYLIDRDRPYDVLDPGPFGSPGWFPDPRTGRHRRDELPDPIPWWEVEEEPEKAEWAEQAEALWERRTRITRERKAREAADSESSDREPSERRAAEHQASGRQASEPEPETAESGYTATEAPRDRRSDDSRDDTDPPEPPSRQSGPEDRPSRQPRFRPKPSPQPEAEARQPTRDRSARQARQQHHPLLPRQTDRRSTDVPDEPPYRFNKLREDAWDRFIEKSADLAAAHRSQTAIEREGGPTIGRIARGIRLIAGLLRHRPRPREAEPVPADRHTALADRTARFAQAMRGAQRARVAITARPAPGAIATGGPNPEATHRTAPAEATRRTASSSSARPGPFIAEWERRFNPRDHLSGGAAWA